MSIEAIKRKSGVFYRAVFCKNRNRVSQCFKRKWDAQKWLVDQEALRKFGYSGKLTFAEAADTWLANHSKIRKAPSSYRGDQRMIRFFKSFFDRIFLEEITPQKVESLISKMNSLRVKHSTINRYLQCLRAILNHFIKKRHLTFNSVSIVGLLPETEVNSDYLSFEEADRFLSYAEQKYQKSNRSVYRLYLLAFNTGLRWGEIISLKWDKVDFLHKRITVARSYCNTSKKIRETTKGRNIRYVGINSSLYPELQAQFQEGVGFDNLVFSKNDRVLDLHNFKRDHFYKDLTLAGIRKIRFHEIRHTFASHFMMRGGNLYDLQKLMGHSNISTTERYAHLSPESLVSKTELVSISGGRNNIIPLQDYADQRA